MLSKEEQNEIDRNHKADLVREVFGLKYPFWEMVGHYKMPLFNENDIVIDIGANIGNFSIAACMKGAKKVIAFEPSIVAYNEAIENIEKYNYSDYIQLNHLAVWKSGIKEEVKYNSWEEGHQTLSINNTGDIIIGSIGLDEILEELDIVEFLKLDCEGSEGNILLTSKLLYNKVNKIGIECHRFKTSEHIELCETSPEDLFKYLVNLGYKGTHTHTTNIGISFIHLSKNNKDE